MPLRAYIVILILLLSGLWPGCESACASGAVDGGVLYGVGQYRAEVEGEEVRTVSTNYQQVSLRYKKAGVLGDARAGKYTLMLGYELSRIAPRVSSYGVNDPDYEEITAKKPFYQAELLLAPGGLPFRLNLYARDLHQSTFVDENISGNIPVGTQANNQANRSGSLIDPEIYTGINNGTHREFGGTFLLGIRNGSYLGAYRDVLSQLPRLLIDYKQVEVNDLSRDRNQQHSRSRDLAFVSLNKLDNWVHFRMRDYTDFINPENNVDESQVIIGLVDQLLERKWINMTNWLKVSGDLSYNVVDEAIKPAAERSYIVNMMAVGQRQQLTTSVFSRFNRTTDGQTVLLESDLPIHVTVEVDRDTRLRSRLIYQASERSLIEGTTSSNSFITGDEKDRDCYLDLQLEMFRSRRVLVVPRLEVESRSEDDDNGLAMRIGSEVLSNSQLSKTLNWLGGYALTVSRSDEALTGESLAYVENNLYGRIDKEINRTWRVGGDASLAVGSGDGRNSISFRIPRMSSQLQSGGGSGKSVGESGSDSSITRGDVTLYLEHRHQRLENRVEFSAETVAADGVTATQLSLQHVLDYARTAHRLKWRSIVNQGDNSGTAVSSSFNYLNTDLEGSSSKGSWSSNATYSYDPSRSLALSLDGAIAGTRREQQQDMTYALTERLVYRLFTTNGIIRRIAEFTEELGYEKTSVADVNGRDSSIFGRFSAAYFPTRYLYGKLRIEMTSYPGSSAMQQVHASELGLDYEKLKLVASYSEGKKSRESATLPEVTERLWNFEVRKIF